MLARLSIKLLRPEAPGSLITQGGDIDNRIKTLLDALRLPIEAELPPGIAPTDFETPFFCLLESDTLVTRLDIDTDRLLADVPVNDVQLFIHVQAKPTDARSHEALRLMAG